ncbi:phage tail protein [Rothia sp. CCM 9417]|uniref:phage tail protein n=1 Tax=Rothia sp. CCM 9417 TaxID=3402657 RepID=UPI003AEF02B8
MATYEYGKVGVRVYPLTRGFEKSLRNKLKSLEKKYEHKVRVVPDLDKFATRLNAAIRRAEREVSDITVRANVKVDRDNLQQTLNKHSGQRIRVPVDVDSEKMRSALDRASKAMRSRPINLPVSVSEDKVHADLLRVMRVIEKHQGGVNVPVGVEARKDFFTKMERLVSYVERKAKPVELPVGLDLDKARLESTISKANKAFKSLAVDIPMDVDTRHVRSELQKVMARIKQLGEAQIPVELEDRERFFREVDGLVDYVEGKKAELTVKPEVDSAAARAELKWLTRPRWVEVLVSVNKTAYGRVENILKRLSGYRMLRNFSERLEDFAKNIDQTLPKLALLSSALASMGGWLAAASSNVFGFGLELGRMLKSVIALPGILAGFATGAAALFLVLSDMGEVLEDLKPRFTELREQMSSNFWGKAEAPIRNLVDNLFPSFSEGMRRVSDSLGEQVKQIANTMSDALSGGQLESMFDSLVSSIDIATLGMDDFVRGLLNIGEIGGQYLPRLAEWFNDISRSFHEWSKTADASEAIEQSITSIKAAGSAINGLVKMWGALGRAALDSGSGGLVGFAEWTQRAADKLNELHVQDSLRKYFGAGHKAMEIFGQAVGVLGDTLLSLDDTFAHIVETGSRAFTNLAIMVLRLFQMPGVQSSATGMFDQILVAVSKVTQKLPEFASLLETAMDSIGAIAPVLADVFAAGIDLLAPAFDSIMQAVTALVPVLGDWLVRALVWVKDNILPLVEAASQWAQANPELASTLLLVVGAVTALVAVLAPIVVSVLTFIGTVGTAVTALGGLEAIMGVVGSVLAELSGAVGLVVLGVAAFVGALVYAWNTSEDFRNAVQGLLDKLVEFAQPILDAVIPALQRLGEILWDVATTALDAFTEIATKVVEFVAAVLETLQPLIDFLGPVLGVAFEVLLDVVSVVWEGIKGVIEGAVDIIVGIFDVFIGLITGNWEQFWAGLASICDGAMKIISSVIDTAWNFILTVIQGAADLISQIIDGAMKFIGDVISRAMDSAVSFFTDGMDRAQQAVSNGIDNVLRFFAELPGNIVSTLGDLGSTLWESGKALINGFINGIKSMAGSVGDAVGRVLGKAREYFPFSPAKRGPFSGRGYTTYSGRALTRDFARGIVGNSSEVQSATQKMMKAAQVGTVGASLNYSASQRAEVSRASIGGGADPAVLPILAELSAVLSRLKEVDERSFFMMHSSAQRSYSRG